jgi:hypothetical protein
VRGDGPNEVQDKPDPGGNADEPNAQEPKDCGTPTSAELASTNLAREKSAMAAPASATITAKVTTT